MRRASIVLLVWIAACGGSQTEPDVPEPNPREPVVSPAPAAEPPPESTIVARNFAIDPGNFAEVNLDLQKGGDITAAFQGDGPVAWNVHSHPEGGVAIHQEGVDASGQIEFEAPSTGGYSVLWTNNGDQVVNLIVSLEIKPGGQIVSWVPEEAP